MLAWRRNGHQLELLHLKLPRLGATLLWISREADDQAFAAAYLTCRGIDATVSRKLCHAVHGATQDADSGSPVADARSTADRFAAFRAAFWKFLRPHTIRGTILGATAITSRALLENQQVGRGQRRGFGTEAGGLANERAGCWLPAPCHEQRRSCSSAHGHCALERCRALAVEAKASFQQMQQEGNKPALLPHARQPHLA